MCSICLEDFIIIEAKPKNKKSIKLKPDPNLLVTSCNHKFHKSCIKELTRPFCPLCKNDITEELLNLDVSLDEIEYRQEEDDIRIYCDHINSNIAIQDLNLDQYLISCINSVNHNKDTWIKVYSDIILDQISNAGNYFYKIYEHNLSKNRPGLFVYEYNNIMDFINSMYDLTGQSICKYLTLRQLKKTPYSNLATQLHDKVKLKIKQFGVLILFTQEFYLMDEENDNVIYTTFIDSCNVITTDPKEKKILLNSENYIAGVRRSKLSSLDILKSMVNCKTVRETKPVGKDINREFKWAKSAVALLK